MFALTGQMSKVALMRNSTIFFKDEKLNYDFNLYAFWVSKRFI